jgi:two-component system response regulator CpxR
VASILVVDDDAVATRLLKLRLEGEGHRVEVACNGQEALECVGESSFDCMITDMCMPRMGGRELCESIRERDPDGGPVIFVVTSRPEDEYRDWTRELRNIEFMEKPVSLQRLAARIAERLPANGCDS